jgi:hypothetical protein
MTDARAGKRGRAAAKRKFVVGGKRQSSKGLATGTRRRSAHRNWKIKEFRQRCLGLIAKAMPLGEIAALGDRSLLVRSVQYRYFVFFGIRVDKEPVASIQYQSPFGSTIGFALARTERLVSDHPGICKHCRNHENDELCNGLVVRRFCDSCRLHLSEEMEPCPGRGVNPECLATCWVNQIGLQSPVCRKCHAA